MQEKSDLNGIPNPKQMTVTRALCCDLDGTVRRPKTPGAIFISGPDDVEILPNVKRILWEHRNAGWLVAGITNQGGVAHGFKKPSTALAENNATAKLLSRTLDGKEVSVFSTILASYNDPSGKIFPYKYRSLLRKPDYGMLVALELEAWARGIVIDWDNSLFVGDRPEDEECAELAGVPFQWAHNFFPQIVS